MNDHLIQNLLNTLSSASTLVNLFCRCSRTGDEDFKHFASVVEATGGLHVGYGVALDLGIGGLLFENVDELRVGRVGPNVVDDGE